MTYDELVGIAITFPEVNEARGFGMVCLRRNRQLMATLKKGGDTVAVKLDWDTRNRLLAEAPDKYFVTKNYERQPWLLVRLGLLDAAEVRSLIEAAWADAPNPATKRK